MRVTLLLAACLTLCLGQFSPAFAVNPNDVPWDEIDRVLKETPPGPEAQPQTAASDNKTEAQAAPAPAAAASPEQNQAVDPAPSAERVPSAPDAAATGTAFGESQAAAPD